MTKQYDLVVLGAGPGGYVAAVRAAQLGMKVAVVEKEKVGGICLHKGCIPSKSLLKSAELFAMMKKSETFGVLAENIRVDWQAIQKRKETVINQLHKGIEQLFAHHQIDLYRGTGRILGPSIFSPNPGTISVTTEDDEPQMLIPQHVLIATGSRTRELPELPFDGKQVLSSDQALQLSSLPSSIVIIGGGAIGIEWASLLNDLGVEVTVVEAMEYILPLEDRRISQEMERILSKRGIQIYTSARLVSERTIKKEDAVQYIIEQKNEIYELQAEKMLISIGRQANVENMGLQNTSIVLNQGSIQVNQLMQTNEKHIYAIGDVVGGYQLAHVASREGIIAVEHMAGRKPEPLQSKLVPRCTYSRPEVASVGWTETEAREKGYNIRIATVPWAMIPKATVMGETDGLVKMIIDEDTQDLLGIHMIGSRTTELIATAGLTQLFDATAWEVGQAIYAHPTLSEVFQEVSMAIDGVAIHKR